MGAFNGYQLNWDLVLPAIGMAALAFLCYMAGRAHQWKRQTDEREQAFIKGYNAATVSLFSMATRVAKNLPAPALMEAGTKEKPKPRKYTPGRHAVDTGNISTLQKTTEFTTWDHQYKRPLKR